MPTSASLQVMQKRNQKTQNLSSAWAGSWGGGLSVPTWTGVLRFLSSGQRPLLPQKTGPCLSLQAQSDYTAGGSLGPGGWGLWPESVRWPGPGPLDPSPASCGLRAHHGCLRKLAGVSWANPAGPGSRLPFRQSPSQLRLQTAARVIVSASPSCECRVYRDRHANSAHTASGEGGES